jgi:DNA-binding transcriptional LysR family regulator
MDIHQLELFLAAMDSPSMTRAAEKIDLSHGVVSLQLHNLADELPHSEISGNRTSTLRPSNLRGGLSFPPSIATVRFPA